MKTTTTDQTRAVPLRRAVIAIAAQALVFAALAGSVAVTTPTAQLSAVTASHGASSNVPV